MASRNYGDVKMPIVIQRNRASGLNELGQGMTGAVQNFLQGSRELARTQAESDRNAMQMAMFGRQMQKEDRALQQQEAITKALSATPAQANEDAVSGDTASRLNEWPDLFGQSSKTPSILPVKKTQSSSPLKTGLESTLPPISKKKISPPQDDGFPTLHSVLKLEENPVPWASVQTGVESNLEQPQVKAASLESPIQEVKVPNEKTPDPKTDSPPAVNASLSKPVSDLPLADSKPSIASAKSSEKKKTSSSKKGFVIKVEGEGKELVVYDAEGNEVLRKSRKKENEGTTISGSGKTVTNRTETEKTVESKTELVESTDPAVKEVPQGTAKTSQPKLIFDEVKKGENLSLIASRYPGIDAKDLMKANSFLNLLS